MVQGFFILNKIDTFYNFRNTLFIGTFRFGNRYISFFSSEHFVLRIIYGDWHSRWRWRIKKGNRKNGNPLRIAVNSLL